MRIIAGPCQHESLEQSLEIARECKRVCDQLDIDYIFKASFDKANRTSMKGQRGKGLDVTLEAFRTMKLEIAGLQTLTDVHDTKQVYLIKENYNDAVDILQIPAFLCRQTDILLASAKTNKVVNIKKGQFLAPSDIKHAINKVTSEGNVETWITERGTTFGYGNLVVDMRSIPIMKKTGCPVIIDASHGIQLPSANGEQSSGQIEFLPTIAKSAISAGADGLFLETHPNPQEAISDKDSQLPLKKFPNLVEECIRLWRFTNNK